MSWANSESGKMSKRLLLSVVVLMSVTACASVSYQDQRSRSSFFVEGQFRNPQKSQKSFWKFLQMRMRTKYAEWPEWVASSYHKLAPAPADRHEMQITHINHSTVLIQVGGYNILTDPIYSKRCSPVSWAGPQRVRNPGIKFADLPKIDLVVISHDHYDHLDLDTIVKLIERDKPNFYVGLGVGKHFPSQENVIEMDWWESVQVGEDLKLHFVPVQHFSGRTLFDRDATLWGGYVFEVAKRRIYFGGDSGYADHYRQTQERLGAMDVSLLPIGAYEPRDFMSYAHMNPEEAVKAHLDLKSKTSIGIHYGTFQLTAEPYDEPQKALDKALAQYKVNSSDFFTPEFGKAIKFRSCAKSTNICVN